MRNLLRNNKLSAPNMYSLIRRYSETIVDHQHSGHRIPLSDVVISATAMFAMKAPDLLKFPKDSYIPDNLQNLFYVSTIPSDTEMREILDLLPTDKLQKCFKLIFSLAQKGKVLESYPYLEGKYLLNTYGTKIFSSSRIYCDNCFEKHYKDGRKTYYHQMLSGAIVHPSHKEVIPIAPEPIPKQDGSSKNDCERVASERLLKNFRREHPRLPVIVTGAGLASNAPHIKLLKELNCNYILGCKKGDHKALFEFMETSEKLRSVHHSTIHEGQTQHKFRFMNQAPLSKTHSDCLVNFMEYEEIKANGKVQRFSWITDIELDKDNLMKIMKGGRARWRIDQETLKTLKGLEYNFFLEGPPKHNSGHGHQNLSNNLAMLMMLVFLMDQLQELTCPLFQEAKKESLKEMAPFWSDNMNSHFDFFLFKDWSEFFSALIYGYGVKPDSAKTRMNTSQ